MLNLKLLILLLSTGGLCYLFYNKSERSYLTKEIFILVDTVLSLVGVFTSYHIDLILVLMFVWMLLSFHLDAIFNGEIIEKE